MYHSDSSSSSSPPHLQHQLQHHQQQNTTAAHNQQQTSPSSTAATSTATSVPVTPYLSQVCNYGPIFASTAYAHHNYSPFHGYERYKLITVNNYGC